jgi:hypothetical protein
MKEQNQLLIILEQLVKNEGVGRMDTVKRSKNIRTNYLSFICDGIVLILLLTVAMTSSMATLVCIGILTISFFFKSASKIVASMFLFYPFYNLFKFGGIGISYYNILIVAAIIALLPKIQVAKRFFNCVLILGVLCVYMIAINVLQNGSLGISSVLLDFFIPLTLFATVMMVYDEIDFRLLIYSFSIGLIIASLCGMEIISLPHFSSYVTTVHYRLGSLRLVRLQGTTGNPNYFSLDLNMAISCLLILVNSKHRIVNITLLAFLTVFGVMTLSKTFLITLAITFVVYYLKQLSYINIKNVFTAGLVLLLLVLFFNSDSVYVVSILSRFNESSYNIDMLTSSRWSIWIGYLQYIFTNIYVLIMGRGTIAPYLIIDGWASYAMHNTYIEVLYYVGIMGAIILVYFIRLTGVRRISRQKSMATLPLFILLVRLLAINIFNREAFMVCLILIGLSLRYVNLDTARLSGNKN